MIMTIGPIVLAPYYLDALCCCFLWTNNAKIMKLLSSIWYYCKNFSLDAAFRCLASATGTIKTFDKVDIKHSWVYCMLIIKC